jgi:hypothetical protein
MRPGFSGMVWASNTSLGIISVYSHPSVSTGDWFQDPQGYQNPCMLSPLCTVMHYLHKTYTKYTAPAKSTVL